MSRALSVVVCLVMGCGGSIQQSPHDALQRYAFALEHGDADEAYRYLSSDAKRNMSLEAFRRAVQENEAEAKEIARSLVRPHSNSEIAARVNLENGDSLTLVWEDGRWRLTLGAVDYYGQSTPKQAMIGFVRAFRNKRYDVLLKYVPDAEREGKSLTATVSEEPIPLTEELLKQSWEGPEKEEITRVVEAISAALEIAVIEEGGDRASMAYGSSGEVVSLVREHGVWKIEDF